MAGMSSNLGASSSSSARKLEEKRKLSDARSDEAKKQRHDPQLNASAHPNGGAAITVVPPLHYAASNAVAVAFPVAGINGAALRWSTAATLGAAASRAAAAALSPPVIAGVNGPAAPFVLPPVPGLQQAAPGAASKALPPPPPVVGVNGGVTAPLVLPRALPLQAISSGPTAAGASNPPPAPAAGSPLAAALYKINDDTLRRMLSEVMLSCDPPMRRRQSWTGAPPPWWPTVSNTMPAHTAVPFAPAYKLNKVQKVAVLVAIVKHHAPNLHRLSRRLSDSDAKLWNTAINLKNEAADETEQKQEQHSNGVVATDALDDEDDGRQQPPISSFPGDDVDGAPLGDDTVNQVAVEAPELQPEDEHGEIRANDDAAAADMGVEPYQLLEDMMEPCQVLEDMLAPYQEQQGEEVHQAVGAEEPGVEAAAGEAPADRPWYVEEDMSSFFDDFEMLVDVPKLD